MKKITFLMSFLVLITWQANAQQPAGNYGFTETTEVYTAVVGTNSTATGDDGSQNTITIPFPFKFEGVTYTNFSINTNGFIRLGNTIAGSPWINLLSNTAAQRPLIAPFWDDNHRNTGSIQYAVTGVPPNQILEIGWDNINIGGGGATSATLFASYKIRLYEINDVIEFIYGPTMANAGALSASVGINGTATFLSVTPSVTSTVSNATANNAISSTADLVGKKFIFTPPAPPSCPAPSALIVTNLTSTTANLGWTENGTATTWNIEWDTTGFTPGTGNIITGTTTNPHNLASLTANTTYQFYVQADCGGSGTSAWVGPFAFTTAVVPGTCGIYSIDLVDTYGDGWNGGFIDIYINGVLYAGGVTLANGTGPMTTQVPVNIGDVVSIDYTAGSFSTENEYYIYDQNTTLVVSEGVGTTPNDVGNYTLPSGLTSCPTCPAPFALTATSITSSSANLGWTENGTATTWNVEWDTTGFTPGTGTMITGTTNNPEPLTGLAPETTYQFYVQADCGGSGTSTWAGPFSFTTPCAAIVAPWNENFENVGLIPNCWRQGVTNAEPWKFSNTGAGNHIGNNGTITGTTSSNGYFAWVDDSSPNSLNTTLESPLIDVSALTIPELSFYLISNNEGFTNVNISLNVWDGSTWNVGFYTHNTNTLAGGWEQITVDVSTLTITGPIQLRFIVNETNGTDFYDDVAIDDVDIHEKPACTAPTVLTATAITSSSADLGWTENGTATAWNIEWGVTGFTQGTGTLVSGTTTNPHNLIGLTAATIYQYYVQADCGGSGTSTWAGPYSFTTQCNTLAVPFLEDFETASPSLPCWSQIQEVGAGNWTFATGAGGGTILAAQSGTQNARFVSASPSGGGTPITKLVSPILDLTTLTTPELTFYYGQEDWAGDQNKLKVYYRISPSDPWVEIAYDTTNIATWKKDSLILPNPSATYQIAFEGINNYGRANVIDDVEIKEGFTPCSIPSNLTAFNITQTSAMLDWTENGTATEWDIEWGFQGFTLGTGTPVHVVSKPYLLNGLTPATAYEYYVRADCGNGDTSLWVGPFMFVTEPCPFVIIDLGNDTTLCSDQSITLNAPFNPNWGYGWSPVGSGGPSNTLDTVVLGGNGTYNVMLNVIDFTNGCMYFDAINVTFSICTGFNENVASNFTIYPNPTNGWITVKTVANDKGEIEITNLQGKVIYKNTLNSNTQNIDLSANAKGVYFVTVTTTNGVEIQKMVIQ